MCQPRVFRKVLSIGKDQLLVFTVTIAATLLQTDLLFGIGIGMLTKLALLCFHLVRSSFTQVPAGLLSLRDVAGQMSAALAELFTSPVIRVDNGAGHGSRERPSVTSAARSVTWSTARKVTDPCRIYLSSVTA